MQESSGRATRPQRPAPGPRRLERDIAPKYEKRVFTPRLPIINDEEEEEKKDDEELEYPDDAPPIPGVPTEFLPPPSPAVRYTFLDSDPSLSAEIDTKTIANNGKTMPASTARKLAASLRRHLNMRTMRDKLGKTGELGRTLRLPRLPGRDGKEEAEEPRPAAGASRGEVFDVGSLARRLLSREKKPKRPKVPEGWLFGPPPEEEEEDDDKHGEESLARRLFGRERKPKRPKVPEGWLFGPPPE